MTSTAPPSPPAVIRVDALLDVDCIAGQMRRAAGDRGVAGTLRSARLLDHKPGRRALVAYQCERGEVYGKAYADVASAVRSFDILHQCHDLFAAAPGMGVPEPVCVLPELAMLLYVPVSGRSLDELTGSGAMISGLESAARWLTVLHRSDLTLDRVLDPVHEATNAGQWQTVVAESNAEAAGRAAALARALATETAPPPVRTVPIHKDFHYQHVIIDAELAVVDFDEARLGDPSFDVAHFSVNLHLLALRTGVPAAEADRWLGSFLLAYAAGTGWAPDAAYRWYAAYTCLKVAKQLTTGSGPRPRPAGDDRRAQVEAILDEGLACLER